MFCGGIPREISFIVFNSICWFSTENISKWHKLSGLCRLVGGVAMGNATSPEGGRLRIAGKSDDCTAKQWCFPYIWLPILADFSSTGSGPLGHQHYS